ncbi:phosphoglycolate phosphatase [Sutcliffiella horikoshii]|uniref:Phosphoglycolate phosphatase n=1 Tax=Sutcliffiella horikoshii TaxID=79883 RepID=A0ABN4ZA75_9BACI|nr:HAD family hydrolase [Sutcliffiella horikoshii]ART75016.1 phosphoglycolate phosphatase [Sutcliffiella horikoshii]
MAEYKVILFDLDGTLSDPKEGITKSVQFALENMDIVEPSIDRLETFIGPPLQVSFAEYYGLDGIESKRAIGFYRERFKEKGMFENVLYPDISLLLEALKERGFVLVVATSKPTVFAEQIIKYFELEKYFQLIVGSNLDGTRSSKTEIIQYILDKYTDFNRSDFVMIGDRKHDIIGAKNTGIHSIGVTYGYGSQEEIRDAEPNYIVSSIDDLMGLLLGSRVKDDYLLRK